MRESPNSETTVTCYDTCVEKALLVLLAGSPLAFGSVTLWSSIALKVIIILMSIVWVYGMFRMKRLVWIQTPLTGFFALFLLYAVVQPTKYAYAGRTGLYDAIAAMLLFITLLNTIKTRAQVERILAVFIGTGFLMSMLMILRHYAVIQNTAGFINPDHFAAYLVVVLCCCLGCLIAYAHEWKGVFSAAIARQLLILFIMGVAGMALLLSFSRGGLVSFAGALAVLIFLVSRRKSGRKKKILVIVSSICFIIAALWSGVWIMADQIRSLTSEIISGDWSGRLPLWSAAMRLIHDNFLFGTGIGTFASVFKQYQPVSMMEMHYTHAHNEILEFFAETGFIGIILAGWGIVAAVRWVIRSYLQRHDPWVVGLSMGFISALCGMALHASVDFTLHVPAYSLSIVVIGAVLIIVLHDKATPLEQKSCLSKRVWMLFGEDSLQENCRPRFAPRLMQSSFLALFFTGAAVFLFQVVRPAVGAYYYAQAGRADGNMKAQLLQRAIGWDTGNAGYYYALGKFFFDESISNPDSRSAITLLTASAQVYNTAAALDAANSEYHQSAAWTYGQLQRYYHHEEMRSFEDAMNCLAAASFEKAIRYDPNNGYRYLSYALWLFDQDDAASQEKGKIYYQQAVFLNPMIEKAMRGNTLRGPSEAETVLSAR